MYSLFDPIYNFHKDFLTILEQRVAEWQQDQQKGKNFFVYSDFTFSSFNFFEQETELVICWQSKWGNLYSSSPTLSR